jgi:hypothetical protein
VLELLNEINRQERQVFSQKTFFDGLGCSKSYSLLPGTPRKS